MIRLGLDGKMFRGTAGAAKADVNIEMKNVKDVTLNMSKGEADITDRSAEGWRVYAATLKEASLEFNINYDTESADYQALANAFLNNTALALFVTDGAGSGLLADFVVTQFNKEEPLEEAQTVSVTARPTNIGGTSGRAPAWIDGGGSGS